LLTWTTLLRLRRDNLILKNVSLDIKAGEKIGVCGRTGSGKTSLVASLFRIINLSSGSIRVDGVDISSLPRQEVRRRIVGVPQQPFLLKGSVRLNADPTGSASDKAIVEVLQCVQLMHLVDENGGLDTDIDVLKLSGGQMQLFCLARAMLRTSKILVLDEATSRYSLTVPLLSPSSLFCSTVSHCGACLHVMFFCPQYRRKDARDHTASHP